MKQKEYSSTNNVFLWYKTDTSFSQKQNICSDNKSVMGKRLSYDWHNHQPQACCQSWLKWIYGKSGNQLKREFLRYYCLLITF